MEGLGEPFDPCHDRRRQGYRQGLLWRGAEAFVLHGLLDRRPAGADRSGILSRRLRRRSHRRAGRQPHLGARGGRVGLYRREPRAGTQAFRREADASQQGGCRGLQRQEQRAQVGSLHRGSRGLRFRPRDAHVPGRGFGRLPDLRRGRDRRGLLFRPEGPRGQDDLLRLASGKRSSGRSTGPSSKRLPTRPASRRSTACSNGCSAPIGIGAISIWIATCRRSTQSWGRSSMARRPAI